MILPLTNDISPLTLSLGTNTIAFLNALFFFEKKKTEKEQKEIRDSNGNVKNSCFTEIK